MNRFLLMLAPAAIAASAFAQTPTLVHFDVGSDAYTNGMSRNGRWATYQYQSEGSVSMDVSVIDLQTGNFNKYTPVKMIDYAGKEFTSFVDGSYSQCTGVSDDGKTVYGTFNGYPGYFKVDELTWHCLSMGDRTANRNWTGFVNSFSADGRVVSGTFYTGGSMTSFTGGVWIDSELQTLTNLPSYEDMYSNNIIDRETYQEFAGQTPNYSFNKVSEDGRYVILSTNHNYPGWGCAYGVYDLQENTFNFILPSKEDGEGFCDSATMSENGKWVTGNFIIYENGDDVNAPFLYNIQTKELQVYKDLGDRDILATAVDNNGTIFGATPASQPMRNMVIRTQNLWVDLSKTLSQKYGMDYEKLTGLTTTGYAVAVSSDNKTLLSQAEMRGGAFALTLPVSFDEAANGTSLLTEYMCQPASGTKFAKISEVMIRFAYQSEPVDKTAVAITDSNGKELARSVDIVASSAQNLLFTIKFPETYLPEGDTYTVTIPEGAFLVPGTTMGNPEIKLNYFGRADEPVKVTRISPADGERVRVLGYDNPITVTFDANLTLSNAVYPKLYEEGKEAPIATLSTSVYGNTLTVYPAAIRYLNNGINYRIEIPADQVADLGLAGSSEPIVINYEGSYLMPPPPDENVLFFDDFKEPNESLANFLQYEGDNNYPCEDMEAVGFDKDNTPWNFSVRDAGSYDYAAMSHSMYDPAGQSDDWLIIPQLELKNPENFLTFKAQGYKANASDILKVYVWENNDGLKSMSDEEMAKLKAEATLLDEFQVIPSQTEGILEGSWTEYEYSLEQFAGKKVYIAFANQNKNQSAIFLDDIKVEYRGSYGLSVVAPSSLTEADETEISAIISAKAEEPCKKLTAVLRDADNKELSKVEVENLNISNGQTYTFTFPDKLPLVKGIVNNFFVDTFVDGVEQNYKGQITNHGFEIARRVLIEESTGMWCGNCPNGEIALEHLEATMPESIAIVSVHNNDAITFGDYDVFLKSGAYPKGRVNRIDKVLDPLASVDGQLSFTSPTGDQTFMDMVLSELAEQTSGEIKFGDVVYYSADKCINLPVDIRFSVNNDKSYSVLTVILENGLQGRQTNYFTGSTDPLHSWWGAQPGKVTYTYNNVARAVRGNFYGESGRTGEDRNLIMGQVYHSDALTELPAEVSNPDNMSFVVALLDGNTGKVVNADVCKSFRVNPTPGASSEVGNQGAVEGITAAEANVRLTVANGTVLVNNEPAAEVYTIAGQRQANENLAKGLYIVRHQFADGSTYAGRVFVK